MPMIINPSAVPLPAPLSDVSSDGFLTVTQDLESGGVLLRAAFPGNPQRVLFLRDGVPVRSGDKAWSSGGVAYAFDHEMPLGEPSTWHAVPYSAAGLAGSPSGSVSLLTPAPAGVRDVWLKSITDPNLSRLVTVVLPVTELTYKARQEFSTVMGNPFPSGSYDVWNAAEGTFTFYAEDAAERIAVQKILTSGILLFQTHPEWDMPDMFIKCGDVVRRRTEDVRRTDKGNLFTVAFTEVDRPATTDSPFFLPGNSWGDLNRNYVSWSHVETSFPNWQSLTEA